MMVKIGLEKTFDKMKWYFVLQALKYYEFPLNISKFIMNCISTSAISVFVNGTRTNFFSLSQGIRQSDLVFLYISILCIQLLSNYINYQVDVGLWEPIKSITPPLYLPSNLRWWFHSYGYGTGPKYYDYQVNSCKNLTINCSKSKIRSSKNCSHKFIMNATNLLGFHKSTNFGKYLGYPILNHVPKHTDFTFVIDNMHNKEEMHK